MAAGLLAVVFLVLLLVGLLLSVFLVALPVFSCMERASFPVPTGDGLRTEDSVAAAGEPIHKKRKNFLIFLLTDQKWFGILSRQNKEG